MKTCFYLIVNKDNKVVAITRNKGKAEFYRKSYNLLENSKHSIIVKYSKWGGRNTTFFNSVPPPAKLH